MRETDFVLEATGLTKHYARTRGIEDVTLRIAPGEIFGFLGPNGAGKTTTIRCLLGLVRPQRGRAVIFGRPVQELDRRRLGVVPGELALYERMTGGQLLQYLAALSGRPPVRQEALLERFAFSRRDLAAPIRHYSRGMKQKLGIVQALQHDPELLIMDEPTEGLDPLMHQEFYRLLGELRSLSRTVFVSSHLLWEVERTCDRVAIIRDGRLVATDRVENLRQRSVRRVEVTFGTPADGAGFRAPAGVTVEHVDGPRVTMRVPVDRVPAVLSALAGLPITDVVWERPSLEDIFLSYYREGSSGH